MTLSHSTLENKKIALLARDPGSANMLFPLVPYLRNRKAQVFLFGKDYALRQFEMQSLAAEDIRKTVSLNRFTSISHWFTRYAPDIIITGLSDDFFERLFWKEATNRGVFSVAILDSWFNLKMRFSRFLLSEQEIFNKYGKIEFLPDSIVCLDEKTLSNLVEEGLPRRRIQALGNPFFDHLILRKDSVREAENCNRVRKSLHIEKSRFVILFFSEPLSEIYPDVIHRFHYTETMILNTFIHCVDRQFQEPPLIIIRPHPKESLQKFSEDSVITSAKAEVRLDARSSSDDHLAIADVAFGMNSMMMIQSFLYGIPTYSVQIGRRTPTEFEKLGFFKPILNESELESLLKRKEWKLEATPALSFQKGCIERIMSFLEETHMKTF